ncbi:MAG: PLP-dependent aminotransferase family protein [Steroidobacteraceae bacterium]
MVAQRPRLNARDFMAHGEPLGYPPLRAAIAGYINRTRAVRCKAGQVVVTSGTQQSLDLVARLLLDRGDEFWMEDPGYAPVTSLLRSHGAKVIGVPVDAQGLDCDAGRRRCRLARLAYVTPHCQFPLGIPMSHERRLKLLQWANEAGAWIFEDDYDGDLPFENTPVAALHSLDRASCVIYSSSFNRLLFPSLRLGFMILPAAFVEPAAAAISISQRYYPVMEQATLAHFILEGHWDMHIRRMRELYQERREALVGAARSELGGLMRLSDSQAGSQVIGWLAPGMSEAEAYRRAAANGIDSIALSRLTIERRMPPGLVLGIGGADIRAIRTGIKHLGRVLRALAWQQGIRATSA